MPLTSQSHPLRVDRLPLEAVLLRGEIGLTFAPGKKHKGLEGEWQRDLAVDLDRLREEYDTRVLVCLLEEHELKAFGISELFAEAAARNLTVLPLPIPDGGVPPVFDRAARTVSEVICRAADGENVVIHCRGGLGRTGLVGACVLVALGVAAPDAIRVVRETRRGAVETRAQEAFIAEFATTWRANERTERVLRERATLRRCLSRVRGCLLGGALGDALGYPVEFETDGAALQAQLGRPTSSSFPFRAPAKISDDTQMTLFIAEGVLRGIRRYNDRGICHMPSVLRHALLRWLATQGEKLKHESLLDGWLISVKELHARRAPGNTCLSALRTIDAEDCYPELGEVLNDSKGCGAVMRSAPIGLAAGSRENAFTLARDSSVQTHGHPSGYLSAAYFAAVIWDLRRGETLDFATRQADALAGAERGHEEVVEIVRRVRELRTCTPDRAALERLGGGWTGEEALAIGLLCAWTAEGTHQGIAEALHRAVAHGGDSDSTGSITGNLLGAMYGYEPLPRPWLRAIELRAVIDRVAKDLFAATELGRSITEYPGV